MVNILLVAHGNLAVEMLRSSEMIAGPQENIEALTFSPDDGLESLQKKVEDYLESNLNREILVMADFKGGSPCNVCSMLLFKYNFSLVAGMNLCMVLEAIFLRQGEATASLIGEKVVKAGVSSIQSLDNILRR